jgi:hypothetical protein
MASNRTLLDVAADLERELEDFYKAHSLGSGDDVKNAIRCRVESCRHELEGIIVRRILAPLVSKPKR